MGEEGNKMDGIAISKLSQLGYALIKEEKYEEAINIFQKILKDEPKNVYALVGIGDTLRKQKKYDDALPYYQTCLEENPTNSFSLFGVADIMRHNNNYEEAIIHWKKYLLYDKDNIAVITRIADSYRRLNRLQESENHYHLALKIDPRNCYAFIGLGWLYFGAKDFQKALDVWLRVLQCPRDEKDTRIYTAIGSCYYKIREYEKAITYYHNAEERDANNFFALFGLANCYRGLGQYEKALEYFKKIIVFDSNNQVVLSRIGDTYTKIGNYAQARSHYKQAMRIQGGDIFAALGLAKLNFIEGNHQRAVDQMIELLQHRQLSNRIHRRLQEYMQDPAVKEEVRKKIRAIL